MLNGYQKTFEALTDSLYEFGPFCLDPAKRLLTRNGANISLTPKAFDVLLLLVQRHGTLITKAELLQTLWADAHVEKANLTQTVFMLRKALGESAGNYQYISTVPGRGYVFKAQVRQSSPMANISDNLVVRSRSRGDGRFTKRLRRLFAFAAGSVAALGILFGTWSRRSGEEKITLAVLPFENLTGDSRQDYFSQGLTEELTVQLQRLDPHLLVIAANFPTGKGGTHNLSGQIAPNINVQYVLEGSVRRDSNKIRASAKLIRTREQSYVWARQYDRGLTNLLALESDVANDIAEQLRSTLGSKDKRQPSFVPVKSPKSFEAYDSYLKGRYFWNKRTSQSLLQATAYFRRATEIDPDYARAYAGLADSYSLFSGYSLTSAKETMPKAQAAVNRALALNPNLAEAHTSSAVINQDYDWNWSRAENEYRRAIELDPTYATAHHWYAELLALQGRFDEAFAESRRARQLDPLSLIIASDEAVISYYSRNYDRSITQFRSVLEMEPGFPRATMSIYVYAAKGMFADAISVVEKSYPQDDPMHWSLLAYVYGLAGQTQEAREAHRHLAALPHINERDPFLFFFVYMGERDNQRAIDCLEQAFQRRSSNLTNLKVCPMYDPLRKDPRFKSLLNRIGLGSQS